MSEHKPYEATPSRRERAKREGDVARSHELANVAAFGAGVAALLASLPHLASSAQSLLQSAAAGTSSGGTLVQFGGWSAMPIAAAAAGASACAAAQSQGLRLVAVSVKLQRLSPGGNFQRMFSREAAITAARATAGFLVAAVAIVPTLRSLYSGLVQANDSTILAHIAWSGAVHVMLAACGAGAIFAAADFAMQTSAWRKRLRMSADELRREQKEHDGDPLARSRRRAIHRSIVRGSLRRVKDAAFVIANPTHVAVALEYRPPPVQVPRVLVRAAEAGALRVRELAAEHGVPVIENVSLARALYASSQPGEYIPHETYVAVAEIVAGLR